MINKASEVTDYFTGVVKLTAVELVVEKLRNCTFEQQRLFRRIFPNPISSYPIDKMQDMYRMCTSAATSNQKAIAEEALKQGHGVEDVMSLIEGSRDKTEIDAGKKEQ